MNKIVTPLDLQKVKTAAKRLKKRSPEKKHMQLLDDTAYALLGVADYHEAEKLSKNIPLDIPRDSGIKWMDENPNAKVFSFGEHHDTEPSFRHGDWFFYERHRNVVFDGEFSPYGIHLDSLSSPQELLALILHIQNRRWSDSQIKGTKVGKTYQVDNFISLISDLCSYYFDKGIREVFPPRSKTAEEIDWKKAVERKQEQVAKEEA